MKKTFLVIALLFFSGIFLKQAKAQDFKGLDKSPMDLASYPDNYRISDKVIKIVYSRPQLKGRSLANLAKFGKKWRTGANEATEITFFKDVNFGGTPVKSGTYTHSEQGAFPRAAGPHQGNALSRFEAEAEATEPRALTPWNRDIPQLQHQRILPSDRPTASILA